MGKFKKTWESAYDKKIYKEAQTGTSAHSVNAPNTSHYLKGETYSNAEVDSLLDDKEDSFGGGTNAEYLRGDKTFQTLNTSVVPESGSNWYYTDTRFNVDWDKKLTTHLPEGTNLYWTQARFDTAFAGKSTSDLSEGTNLYFTVQRARDSISNTKPIDYNSSTGVISFDWNTTNLKITSDQLNTIQNIHTGASPTFSQLTLAGSGDNLISGNFVFSGSKSYYNDYVSGFAGTGFLYDYDGADHPLTSFIEFDHMLIRKTLTVFEFIINQIRATNGSLWVSSAARVKSTASAETGDDVTFEDVTGHGVTPFMIGDIVYSQRVSADFNHDDPPLVGNIVKLIVREVITLNGLVARLEELGDGPTEVGDIEQGDTFVRVGSTSDSFREGAVYLTSDDSGSPFIDIYDGVKNWTDFNSSNKLKSRLGKLTGIKASGFGALEGYGLYTNNAYLEGDAHVRGSITVGDADGYGNTFYAGRINKNMLLQSQDGDWGDTNNALRYWTSGSVTVTEPNIALPAGETGPAQLIVCNTPTAIPFFDMLDSDTCNAGDQRNRTFTLSFWAKADSTATGTHTAKWNFPINTQIGSDFDFIVTEDWKRYSYKVTAPNSGTGSDTLRWLFTLPINAFSDGIYFWGFQFEESDHASAYQETDGSLEATASYGMWSIKGGFGGTMQNPRVALQDEGIIIRKDGGSNEWFGYDTISIGFSGSTWGIIGKDGSSNIFQLGSTNNIAGWNFDFDTLSNGDVRLSAKTAERGLFINTTILSTDYDQIVVGANTLTPPEIIDDITANQITDADFSSGDDTYWDDIKGTQGVNIEFSAGNFRWITGEVANPTSGYVSYISQAMDDGPELTDVQGLLRFKLKRIKSGSSTIDLKFKVLMTLAQTGDIISDFIDLQEIEEDGVWTEFKIPFDTDGITPILANMKIQFEGWCIKAQTFDYHNLYIDDIEILLYNHDKTFSYMNENGLTIYKNPLNYVQFTSNTGLIEVDALRVGGKRISRFRGFVPIAPNTDLQLGDIVYLTESSTLKIFDGSLWIAV